MANQENEDATNSIRVVEDDAPKEVVRLDPAKTVRIKKKSGISVEKIEARRQDQVIENPESQLIDPEHEWLKEKADGGKRAVPMGWFVLLGVGLLGIVLWAGLQVLSEGEKPAGETSIPGVIGDEDQGDKPLGKVADEMAQEDAAKHFEETEKVLRAFFGASTPEERAQYVRHPERVKPLMMDYYSRNKFEKITYDQISEYQIFPLEKLPFLALQIKDAEGESHAILLEDGEEELLVDWESFVCFQPVSIEDYARDRPTGLVTLRAYVSPDYFHSHEFESQEKYASFRLRFRNSEVLLNGYVERGTELEQKFRKLFPEQERAQLRPLILTVRFLPNGKAPLSVLIESLDSTLWAYAKNPAEVASSVE